MKNLPPLLHYIWIGNNPIPDYYQLNYQNTQKLNPTLTTILWTDNILQILIPDYYSYSLPHKLQLAKYTILNIYGGTYTDFDITWHTPIHTIIHNTPPNTTLTTITRNSLHFYNKHKKTQLLDDYFLQALPEQTNNFLNYCLYIRNEHKQHPFEPYSVYALSEWITETQRPFTHTISIKDLGPNPNSIYAYHLNQSHWQQNPNTPL